MRKEVFFSMYKEVRVRLCQMKRLILATMLNGLPRHGSKHICDTGGEYRSPLNKASERGETGQMREMRVKGQARASEGR